MIIFFDIETVAASSYSEKDIEKYGERIHFMPEFNKIVSIAVGYEKAGKVTVKALKWTEKEMIKLFFSGVKWHKICGFNIKNFDIPFVLKRAIHHKIKIPNDLKVYGKKPWDMDNIIDLFEIYKCNIFGSYGNLELVSNFLWISNPKEAGIDGSAVQQFFDDGKIDEINEYCVRDVAANMEIYKYFTTYNMI